MTTRVIARYALGLTITMSVVSISLSALVFSGLFLSERPILQHILDRPWLIVGYPAALAFAAIWIRPLYQILAHSGKAIWLDGQQVGTAYWSVPASEIVEVKFEPERKTFLTSAPAISIRLESSEIRVVGLTLLDGTGPEIVASMQAALKGADK